VFDASAFDTPSTKQAVRLLEGSDAVQRPTLVVLTEDETTAAYSFRNIERTSVLPADGVGVADIVGAASLVVSEAALDELTRRATA